MKFEDIKKANETIITTGIEKKDKNGKVSIKEYAEVNQRVKAFRMLYPKGSIVTNIESLTDGMVIMSCEVRDEEGKLLSKDYSYEKENSSFVNKTSFIENCSTSATGRALAYCGIGIDTSIASKEEVENAIKQQEEQTKLEEETQNTLIQIKKLMKDKKILPDELHDQFNKNSADMDLEELKEVVRWLEQK